ncbi:MAG TPA: glycoside hydrolase family 43 protein [Kiritimatiellia bacterium]|nr:glycoside hydrolase family 43 protein [Kiritimatiellia bacterium]HPS09506.1 glycoside hydrolase family 43 protein [Kiritimatiellia bacterium]
MKNAPRFISAALIFASLCASAQTATLKTEDIRIRDPFIFADAKTATYYLYAQSENRKGSRFQGVEVYTSTNLTDWAAPRPVLALPNDQGVSMVWAPEMHAYGGAYYLFVTLTFRTAVADKPPADVKKWPPMHRRGTWIFRADSPAGPFKPLKNDSHTPPAWMALDGTLYVDSGTPYMVFCHEWVQLIDGTVDAVALKSDLTDSAGEPVRLFSASDAPGAKTGPQEGKVTDGPFLYKSPKSGTLFMIWSTFIPGKGYCVLLARSESGRVAGPWKGHTPLYTTNGGHGMIFTAFDGRLLLALHQPNTSPQERLRFIGLTDDGATLLCAH